MYYCPTHLCAILCRWQYSTAHMICWKNRRASSSDICSAQQHLAWARGPTVSFKSDMVVVRYPAFFHNVVEQFSSCIFNDHDNICRRRNDFVSNKQQWRLIRNIGTCKTQSKSAYSLMICGCRSSFKYCISRFTRPLMSMLAIFFLLIILSATFWPVTACTATAHNKR